MGTCLSCSHSSDDHTTTPQQIKKEYSRSGQGQGQGLGVGSSSLSGGVHRGSGSMRERERCGDAVGGSGGSSHQKITKSSSTNTNEYSSPSVKVEKKAFYARIPPLGRVGSDKKSSTNPSTTNANIIKDNNNAYSEAKIAALYDHYKDSMEDAVLAEGIERLCKDLDVKPEDFKMLVLAWKFGAEQMCRFTRDEFFRGMRELGTDTIIGIQTRLPELTAEVTSDSSKFKDLYRFSFKFGLDSEINERVLPIDMAISLWRVVFSQRDSSMLQRWINFLEAHPHIRGIPKDTWNMFLNLVDCVGDDLSNYDDTEAWPTLFDDFVEYENDQLNQNTISSATGGNNKSHQTSSPTERRLNCSSNSPL